MSRLQRAVIAVGMLLEVEQQVASEFAEQLLAVNSDVFRRQKGCC